MVTDQAARKRATRAGRRRGCYIYITAEDLTLAGIDPHGPTPYYRVWAARHSPNTGRAVVSLYREP